MKRNCSNFLKLGWIRLFVQGLNEPKNEVLIFYLLESFKQMAILLGLVELSR